MSDLLGRVHRRDEHQAADDRLRFDGSTRDGCLDARPRRGQLREDLEGVPRWPADRRPHPRPRPRQHHALLADQHVDVGGAALLGELPEHRGGPRLGAEAAGYQGADRVHGLPQELFQAPRGWAEKVYPNLTYFNDAPKGGRSLRGRNRRSSPRSWRVVPVGALTEHGDGAGGAFSAPPAGSR